ncbi:hypothetical protein BDV96DRAFT_105550 [Lophiotrema nucula]|uniref:DUF7820 domain-containing protein n=1 Tax=Lophiotrema nucula TaxID=690887 RepID=A0A6A5Z3G1_9PLEO|nr:hypothetical protein BDV96DRAFT_105550 [Lophiotrema nucula]
MRFPRRSVRSISENQLPTIQTQFLSKYDLTTPIQIPANAGEVEDGIEVVPLERQNSSAVKQITLGDEGMEVVPGSKLEFELATKPLPQLPKTIWMRLSFKYRVLAVVCTQLLILLVIGLSLMSLRAKKSKITERLPPSTDTRPNLPIKVGTYAFKVKESQHDSECLAREDETAAWTCDPKRMLRFSLSHASDGQANATYASIDLKDNLTFWGAQGPNINQVLLNPAIDPENPANGMAYHFLTTYNRTVVLKEGEIGDVLTQTTPEMNKTYVKDGERLWLCAFEQTEVEGYIYVSQSAQRANQTVPSNQDPNFIGMNFLPYFLKLREMRTRESPQPYCTKMQMQNGTMVPAMNGGSVQVLQLHETHVEPQHVRRDMMGWARQQRRQTTTPWCCRCQWLWQ